VIAIAQLVLLDLTKAQVSGVLNQISEVDFILRVSFLEPLYRLIAVKLDWWILAIINLCMLFLCLRRAYIGEPTYNH
jgi:hypothetical protein